MYKYQHLPIEQAKVGDLVKIKGIVVSKFKQGSLHLVTRVTSSAIYVDSINSYPFSFESGENLLNLIQTKPMQEFKMKPFTFKKHECEYIVTDEGRCTELQFIACCNKYDIIDKVRTKKLKSRNR